MKYALITDNSVQWFSYVVSICETGECCLAYQIITSLRNDYLNNLFDRELNFSDLRLVIPGQSCDTWCGNWISKYEFERVVKMILLYGHVQEYERLGKLEKI